MNRLHLFLACLSSIALLCTPVWADIINGNFEQPLTVGWSTPGDGLAEIVSGYGTNATSVAHLKAASDFTFVEGDWDGDTSQAVIQQIFTAEAGKSTLLFDASYATSGLEVGNAVVTYTAFGGGGGTAEIAPGESWATHTLALLDGAGQPLAAGTPVLLTVTVQAGAPLSSGDDGQQVSQVAEGYFDNFRLVPEPCTILLMLAGLPLLRHQSKA